MTGPSEMFRPERLLAFSDGVFGVAITLLVIDLRLPPDEADLPRALLALGPKLALFVFTFLVVGATWLAHHRKFSYVDKVDGRLLWLNLVYLMALCLVPFSSSVLGEHGGGVAFALYAGVMTLIELLSASLSAYILRAPFLAGPRPHRHLRHDMTLSPLLSAGVFALAGAIALAGQVTLAHWTLLAIIPVMSIFGARARSAG